MMPIHLSCKLVPFCTCQEAQVCLKSCQRKLVIPARLSAAFQALVEQTFTGLPRKGKTYSVCSEIEVRVMSFPQFLFWPRSPHKRKLVNLTSPGSTYPCQTKRQESESAWLGNITSNSIDSAIKKHPFKATVGIITLDCDYIVTVY